MKLKEFIKQLEQIKSELQDKEIFIRQPNGLLTHPEIKFNIKIANLDTSKKNVESIIIM